MSETQLWHDLWKTECARGNRLLDALASNKRWMQHMAAQRLSMLSLLRQSADTVSHYAPAVAQVLFHDIRILEENHAKFERSEGEIESHPTPHPRSALTHPPTQIPAGDGKTEASPF